MFFPIHLINMYSSFQNIVHVAKQMQYTLERILSDFLSDGFLIFFKNIEMSMELYNGEKSACFTYSLVESVHTVRNPDFFMNMSTA